MPRCWTRVSVYNSAEQLYFYDTHGSKWGCDIMYSLSITARNNLDNNTILGRTVPRWAN